MKEINHYKKIYSDFLAKRREYQEQAGRAVPQGDGSLPIAGLRTVEAAILVFDIANSSRVMSTLSNNEYGNWLGRILHLLFHIVNDFDGQVDKYTGDGAMISFSYGNRNDRCTNALECALKMSEIMSKIINPLKKKTYPEARLRIGIDFGKVSIERIGLKSKSHLIILGKAANNAKRLEQYGKKCEFIKQTTILIGNDVLITLPKYLIKDKGGDNYVRYFNKISGKSEIDGSKPYKIYRYVRRI